MLRISQFLVIAGLVGSLAACGGSSSAPAGLLFNEVSSHAPSDGYSGNEYPLANDSIKGSNTASTEPENGEDRDVDSTMGSPGDASEGAATTPVPDRPVSGSLPHVADTDGDGIPDTDDAWPTDPALPQTSQLWGVQGELWDTDPSQPGIQSRLPFYGLAGYRDGRDLPAPSCSVWVEDFGARVNDGVDDTDAFWSALAQARDQAAADNLFVICLREGIYNLSRQLHLNQSGLVLRGSGRDQTVLNFKQGMIAQSYPEFVGNVSKNWSSNKAIVLGDSGLAWANKVNLGLLGDEALLPKRGDLVINLPAPLTDAQFSQLAQTGFRINLVQPTHYSNRDEVLKTPVFTAGIFGGPEAARRVREQINHGVFNPQYNEFTPMKFLSGYSEFHQGNYDEYKYGHGTEPVKQQFVVRYEPGDSQFILDRPVRFDTTLEDPTKTPWIQFVNPDKSMDTDIGIERLTIQFPATPWGDCSAALPDYPCNTGTARHSGYWAQGGIHVASDFSWVSEVRFINAGNPLKISGAFNTARALLIDSNRPTTEGTAKSESPQDTAVYRKSSPVGHVGIGLSGQDNLVDDVVIRANFIHTLSAVLNNGSVYSNVRAEQPLEHPTDSLGQPFVKINLDHHRQVIHAALWTQIQLGGSQRMWNSTGGITEGFNAGALNTYWGIDSLTPELDYWPHNNKGSVEWGYHYINIVGTNIQAKPAAPTFRGIEENPYPYAYKNPELWPFPYHPDNAHLESIKPSELWPANLYHAQREAYFQCKLLIKPAGCGHH